jgi:hypothetical protein
VAPRRGELRIGPVRLRRRAAAPRDSVDVFSHEVILGCALHKSGIRAVRVYRDEIPIGDARLGLERPDVHAAYPGSRAASGRAFYSPWHRT